ncbi:MAG: ABC transporter permease/substrate-binding protein [Gammaproteobacteria bacterium]|nr:ABC transporter permease/substrate-binding protein [Gammaproteobacteria bacterium]
MTDTLRQQLALLPDYLSNHLLLSLVALAAGTLLSLPLAFVAIRFAKLGGPILAIASTIQTIPGLALLALMVPLLRQIGFLPAVIALTLYSVLPILRNAVTGIANVDDDLIEAGRGLGMTDNQLLLRVQLPLALPVIVAGFRTATVWVVGIATLSTPVGATSLGNYIFSGLQTQNYTAVVVGCVAAATLALVLDRLIRSIELALQQRRRRLGAAGIVAATGLALLAAWPLWFAASLRDADVVIGTKTFTEQYILGRLIAGELESAGLATRTLDSLGSTVAFDALAAGRIDVYVDYTGTVWANYMQRTDNPGRAAIAAGVENWLRDEHGIGVVANLGFENAYALGMARAEADARGIRTIDDLVPYAAELTIGGDYEFFERPEWRALAERYRLSFRERVSMDSTLMYAAVATGDVDVISAFSTDGRIAAFDLVVLDDTRGALPPYDAVLLVNGTALERLGDDIALLRQFDGAISADAMRAANKHVDLDDGTVGEAAALLAGEIR